jgi:hypothetical protein
MKRATLLVAATLLAVVVAIPGIAAVPEATYLDTFGAQGFSGNNGDADFDGPWVEIGESNGPTVGYVWVWDNSYCDGAFCLIMGGIDEEAAGTGAYRAVDLSGATWAKLTFDYGRELLDDDSEGTGIVQVSPNGGSSWNTVKTVRLNDDDDGLKFRTTVVISDWASAETVIRFKITEADDLEAYWLVDNVEIVASFESPTTTTTQPTTTTSTTEPDTTTTTKPTAAATTTTQPRATSTTTMVPKREDDVHPPTTTTVPRTTTTTRPPATASDVPPEDYDTMMEKSGLAIVSAAPPMAMPALASSSDSEGFQHAEPAEALAAAFFTDSGTYGWNLLPSIALGIVIAVVTLLGIGSRRQD